MKTFRALLLALGLFGAVSGASAGSYTVKAGDTLYKVARNFRMDPVDLIKLNNLSSSTIQVGQTLKVADVAELPAAAPAPARTVTSAAPRGGVVRAAASRFLGIPYRLGGTGAGGIDCSAFTRAVMAQMGVHLPRTSAEQFGVGTPVARGNLQAGDLVFFNTLGRGVSHVGIYIGDGQFAHANSYSGRSVVDNLSETYYRFRYVGARRVVPGL